ncbi:peroxisomal membrane protein 11A [Cryptomeria japonica]|uniref:peroxisomal membrane protein 11A n=1 Tax=Cryptomeria japonica TaxID=3369 RepID=UPI0027DA3451|nr:peroxisomal membrane protein 11A [Cryptomeria japonica]XP_057832667.2 peroxisomal membrane protein 11A [Cryptomeria japonica]
MELQKNLSPDAESHAKAVVKSSGSSSSITSTNSRAKKERDFTDHLEAYLARRDGVDKLLKIARYSSKVILASSVVSKDTSLYKRLKDFEASVGVSRKAFRLGKFIQDYNALKQISLDSTEGRLGILAYGGEGIYYFVEQFTWLIKAGLIDKQYAAKLQKISAWCEFIGYCGSISLKSMQILALREKQYVLASEGESSISSKDSAEISQLREKQVLKLVSVIQDFADGLMALSDILDGKGSISSPLLLASAGLLSALISTHKNWSSS